MQPIDVLRRLTDGPRLTEDEKEAVARAIELYDALRSRANAEKAFQRSMRAHDALDGGPSQREALVYPWPTGVRPWPRELLPGKKTKR